MARSFEPGTARDRRIKQACRERGCTLTALVNDAIDMYLDTDILDDDEENPALILEHAPDQQSKPTPKGKLVSSEPYDICNESIGCISRYSKDGNLMFHFMPTHKDNGVQYYHDTLSKDPKNKWHKDVKDNWIQHVTVH